MSIKDFKEAIDIIDSEKIHIDFKYPQPEEKINE